MCECIHLVFTSFSLYIVLNRVNVCVNVVLIYSNH